MKAEDRAHLFPKIAALAGHNLQPNATVLDFGCGEGWKLLEQRKMGYKAYGMDVLARQDAALSEMRRLGLAQEGEDIVRIVSLDNYRVPFDDGSFDFIYSDHVMEHVQNLDESFAEMRRLLKPGGIAIHIFPTRWRIFEAHTKTPFGGVLRSHSWLKFWHRFNVPARFAHQDAEERANSVAHYLGEETNYPPASIFQGLARRHFKRVQPVEHLLMQAWGGKMQQLSHLPGMSHVISALHVKSMLLQ